MSSNFSTSFSTPIFFLNNSHLNEGEVVSHCGFGLNFSNDQWGWAPFHVYLFKFLDHFLIKLFGFFVAELQEVFIDSGY